MLELNSRKANDQRIITPLPNSKGKKHYWDLSRGDYGFYQSEFKEKLNSRKLHDNQINYWQPKKQKQYNTKLWNKRHQRSKTQVVNDQPTYQQLLKRQENKQAKRKDIFHPGRFQRNCVSQLEKPNNQYDIQYTKSLEPKGDIKDRYQNPELYGQYNSFSSKNIEAIDKKQIINLPKIKKSVEQEAQTSNSLIQYHPMFNKNKQNVKNLNKNSKNQQKNEHSVNSNLKKIRKDIQKSEKSQITEAMLNKVALRYSPTYASSSQNTMHHYFEDESGQNLCYDPKGWEYSQKDIQKGFRF